MATITRRFDPSTTGRGLKKRREHLMIVGGREGPEIGMKQVRTPRFADDGSELWTEELSEGRTKPDARTQPPFLRGVQSSQRAYTRGMMTVVEMMEVAEGALERARDGSGSAPLVEYTAITPANQLAAVTGTLIDADVDTLAQTSVPDWGAALSQLASDVKAIELRVGKAPKGETRVEYMAPTRVYLGLKGSDKAIPIEQMAVTQFAGGGTALGSAVEVTGVYAPSETDPMIRYKGQPLKAGEPINLVSSLIEYVSVDPPEYRKTDYINSPAFARSRGFVIELSADLAKRIGLTGSGRVVVPYSTVLRLRAVYPPAQGYERKASRVIEDNASIEREIEAARRHLARIRDALVVKAASRATKEERMNVAYKDKVTGFYFGLEDASVRGLGDPKVVWREIPFVGPKGTPEHYPPGGEAALIGRRVTPIDFLRVLRAERAAAGLSKLRSAEARRQAPSREYKANPTERFPVGSLFRSPNGSTGVVVRRQGQNYIVRRVVLGEDGTEPFGTVFEVPPEQMLKCRRLI
jgi:hypothetical protein